MLVPVPEQSLALEPAPVEWLASEPAELPLVQVLEPKVELGQELW